MTITRAKVGSKKNGCLRPCSKCTLKIPIINLSGMETTSCFPQRMLLKRIARYAMLRNVTCFLWRQGHATMVRVQVLFLIGRRRGRNFSFMCSCDDMTIFGVGKKKRKFFGFFYEALSTNGTSSSGLRTREAELWDGPLYFGGGGVGQFPPKKFLHSITKEKQSCTVG